MIKTTLKYIGSLIFIWEKQFKIMKKLQLVIVALWIMTVTVYISKTSRIADPERNSEMERPGKRLDTLEDALAKITSDSSKSTVFRLSSEALEGRMSGKRGNVEAAEFIKASLDKLGYQTKYQKFNIERINPGPKKETGDDFTSNVCAWSPGSDEDLRKEVVVVGAHFDHIGYGPRMSMQPGKARVHPGADDNASGTAALLEIAKAMSNVEKKRTLLFIAFSAEEMGLLGSKHYVENPLLPEDKPSISSHVFMLNMDMVGHLRNVKRPTSFSDAPIDINRHIGELGEKYPFAKFITSRTSGGSDHASFYNKKVPVAFLHTGGHDYYHTPQDTPESLNYDGLEKVSKYATELVFRVCNDGKKPTFNHNNFKKMSDDHDHGIVKFQQGEKK